MVNISNHVVQKNDHNIELVGEPFEFSRVIHQVLSSLEVLNATICFDEVIADSLNVVDH